MRHINTLDETNHPLNSSKSIGLLYSDHRRNLIWLGQTESSPLCIATFSEMNPQQGANTIAVPWTLDLHPTLCQFARLSPVSVWINEHLPSSLLFQKMAAPPTVPHPPPSPSSLTEWTKAALLHTQGSQGALESWKMTELLGWAKRLCWDMTVCLPVGPASLIPSSSRASVIIWSPQGQAPTA